MLELLLYQLHLLDFNLITGLDSVEINPRRLRALASQTTSVVAGGFCARDRRSDLLTCKVENFD